MGKIEELMKKVLIKWHYAVFTAGVIALILETTDLFFEGAPTTIAIAIGLYIYMVLGHNRALSEFKKKTGEKISDNFIETVKSGKVENLVDEDHPHLNHELDRLLENGSCGNDTSRERLTRFFQELLLPRILNYNEILKSIRDDASYYLNNATIHRVIATIILIILVTASSIIFDPYNRWLLYTILLFFLITVAFTWKKIREAEESFSDASYYLDKLLNAESRYLDLERSLRMNNNTGIAKALKDMIPPKTDSGLKL